ncbi:acyl--CoA ligase [Tsuneonella sp. YG55]|uniref:Acyl--CoA ligase n=1 Tax=Tsuneonella litorea TaxID=2976475 RepID=A0A9X2VYA6_9SPHN|nr:class I adenylate-forming enzyme family protein [Tsuneonella litorea]MCT2557525.1 acyl--CoA ligase [Tsuneonella litorea]
MQRKEAHFGRIMRCYADRPANVWQRLAAIMAANASAVAVVENGEELTYGRLDSESASLANWLANAGVGQGDRVAVMLNNGADAVRAVVAIVRLGAVLVALGTRSRAGELSHFFADAEPSAVIHGPEFTSELEKAEGLPRCRLDVSRADWRAALAAGAMAPIIGDIREEATFALLYTSGTTGRPKGAMLSHLGVVHSCMHWREAFDLGDNEATLFCVPWAHVSGLCGVLMPFLFQGAKLVMMPEFNRHEALRLARDHAITHALMVPAMYGLLLLEPDLADFKLASWRIAAYGGAPMPEATIERFAQAFPDLAMCNAYGATETTSPATIMPPGEGTTHADSIGRVVACGDIRVMDEAGREVPAGENGEFWIAGPMVSPGYWRSPEATKKAFEGGYWRSGDIGSVDADGYVRIADRKKDMIIRGGFKVYPAEVENVITAMTGVTEVAVVGRPDPLLDEEVIAFVSNPDCSITDRAVREWCAARLSDYKVPAVVKVECDPLPRNANGKIQKAPLRDRALALPATQRLEADA